MPRHLAKPLKGLRQWIWSVRTSFLVSHKGTEEKLQAELPSLEWYDVLVHPQRSTVGQITWLNGWTISMRAMYVRQFPALKINLLWHNKSIVLLLLWIFMVYYDNWLRICSLLVRWTVTLQHIQHHESEILIVALMLLLIPPVWLF